MAKSLYAQTKYWLIIGIILTTPTMAFDSGSSEADGAFNPIVNTTLQLPPDGIFNFTSINIPANVDVSFRKNATNTPVTILASGNVTINGDIFLFGGGSTASGAAGGGNLGDDGIPGQGGAGGFAGGRGGDANSRGGNGLGPGGGISGSERCGLSGDGGGGGGFGSNGGNADRVGTSCLTPGGPAYGSNTLLPLIGGSGGGGGHGGGAFSGVGGGGGGGAILIAASGTVTVSGRIFANGGRSGQSIGTNCGGTGGDGSGGAIRIVATTIAGNGTISAVGGSHPFNECAGGLGFEARSATGGIGSPGRIRLEAEIFQRTAATTPGASGPEQPGDIFVAGLPSLSITSVAGVSAPAVPTGSADIVLPETTPNPVEVIFATTDVPQGNFITLKVTPATGASSSTNSSAILADGTAVASINNLPSGPSVLSARVSFTVTAALGNALSTFAQGEQVERVVLAANMNGPSMTTLITVSGKEYTLPSKRVPIFKRTL